MQYCIIGLTTYFTTINQIKYIKYEKEHSLCYCILLGSCGSTSELRTLRNYYYSTEKFFDDMDKSVYDSVLEQMDTDSGSQYLYWREKAEQYEP